MEFTGKMHCWVGAIAELAGRRYVLVRGTNYDDELSYDKTHEGVELEVPFGHTPSVKYNYGVPDVLPNKTQVKKEALQLIAQEWPEISAARLVFMDQEFSGRCGGFPIINGERKIDPVTQFVFDFGKVKHLPYVILKPNQKLAFSRHPIFWLAADEIAELPRGKRVLQGGHFSNYYMEGARSVEMEIEKGQARRVVLCENVVLQHTIGDMYKRAGVRFKAADVKREVPFSLRGVEHKGVEKLLAGSQLIEKVLGCLDLRAHQDVVPRALLAVKKFVLSRLVS